MHADAGAVRGRQGMENETGGRGGCTSKTNRTATAHPPLVAGAQHRDRVVLTHSLAGQESCRWTKFFIYFFWEKKGQESKQSDGPFRGCCLEAGASHGKHERNARHALVCCLFVFLAALALAGGTSVRCLCCSLSRPTMAGMAVAARRAACLACLPCLFHAPSSSHITTL